MDLEEIGRSDGVPSDDHSDLRMLWILRILCRTSARSRYLGKGRRPDALHAFLSLFDEAFETRKTGEIGHLLDDKLAALETRNPAIQDPLKENLAHLKKMLELTEVDIEVLALSGLPRFDGHFR